MLEEVLAYINNWFDKEKVYNDFSIVGGSFAKDIPMLQEGQYFRIEGSIFNDGLHQWPATDLDDESFTGCVVGLAVPKAVIALADSIAEWQESHGDAASGPFQSESFNNYSYSLKTAQSGSGGVTEYGWKAEFRPQLNRWRKL